MARFAANKPDGFLLKQFEPIANPTQLTLSLDYGWGWGDAGQGADAVGCMLLDRQGDGYLFEVHRTRANWAVQWTLVTHRVPAEKKTWADTEIDAQRPSVRDGGGLGRLTITRAAGGDWRIASKDWNQGAGASVAFHDATTQEFSELVLLGTHNFDEQVFDHVRLEAVPRGPTVARPASEFLDSLGIVTTFPDRGQPLAQTIDMVKHCGFRWVRGGIEGLSTNGPTTLETYLELHRKTGVRFSWGLVSGGVDLTKLLETARVLAEGGALLALEGNNEPNNWGVVYEGVVGGGRAPSWMAVAKLQRDMCAAAKRDPLLKRFPVWSISEVGGETDNVGLQFLTIPPGAGALLPEGTQFADFANVHNYIYHPGSPGLADNKTWNAADPTSACKVDGLYGNYGRTWAKKFRGYSDTELETLPRVTTETGCTIGGPITEEIQALNILSMYLDQFARGWRHTSVYLLRDRVDESGNQTFGLYRRDNTPRKAATYLHNLTTILADSEPITTRGSLDYTIADQPATVHDLLLQQGAGRYALVAWGERLQGVDKVTVRLGRAYAKIRIHDPTLGTEEVRTADAATSLDLTLGDHPVIVLISER